MRRRCRLRTTGSLEPPLSGQPAYAMTGGNMRITAHLANPVTDNTNYNANNATRLKASPAFLTHGF